MTAWVTAWVTAIREGVTVLRNKSKGLFSKGLFRDCSKTFCKDIIVLLHLSLWSKSLLRTANVKSKSEPA